MTNQNKHPNNNIDDVHHVFAAVEAAWNAASLNWNPGALATLYTEDACLFGGRPDHSVGKQAIREYFASYNGIIESASLVLQDQYFKSLGTEYLLAQGYGQFSFDFCNGQTSAFLMRTTLVIERQDNEWKICRHHFSAPPTTPPLGMS